MANKLDQSLDAIIGDRPTNRRGRAGRRPRTRAAPVGGVKKAVATAKGVVAKAAAKVSNKNTAKAEPAAQAGATKVLVSNLPTDVSEAQIKEYFQQVAGPVRRVWLTYGPNGTSRGIATIQFSNAAGGAKAMEQKGTKVDGRAIRVEAIVNEAGSTATPKTLRERATAPNAQPKKATADARKATATRAGERKTAAGAAGATTAGATRGRGRTARGRNAGRPKKKTAEELDAEMTDYFGAGTGVEPAAQPHAAAATGTGAAANPQAGDDMGMDEIS